MRISVLARDRRKKVIGCSYADRREHPLPVLGGVRIECHRRLSSFNVPKVNDRIIA
jgi:hypothetical protein